MLMSRLLAVRSINPGDSNSIIYVLRHKLIVFLCLPAQPSAAGASL